MSPSVDYQSMLQIAIEEARQEAFPLARRYSIAKGICSVGDTTDGFRKTIHLFTVKPTRFAKLGDNVDTATRSWSRRWPRAGTAAG